MWWRSGRWAQNAVRRALSGERLESRASSATRRRLDTIVVYSLSKRTVFSLCIQSKCMACLPVHFFGRTLLCPGVETCPACTISRPKCYWYAICTVERKLEVVEFCDSLARAILEQCATINVKWSSGVVVRGSRKSKRSMWTLDEFTLHAEFAKQVADKVLIDGISTLYQLPIGRAEESAGDWLQRVKTCHVPLLARCVIPM